MGLHLLPLGFVEVNAVADIPVELIDAHFPGYTRDEILAYAHLCRNYDYGGDPDNPQPGPNAPDVLNQNGSRANLTLNAPGYVVMPFNVEDNDSQTNSLGKTRIDHDAWKLAGTWPFVEDGLAQLYRTPGTGRHERLAGEFRLGLCPSAGGPAGQCERR